MGQTQTDMTPSTDDRTKTPQDPRSSREIEADIHQTRGRMDATLDELGERLTVRSLLNTALDWWEGSPRSRNRGTAAAAKAAGTLGEAIREHPMPALLIGAGIAWWVRDSRQTEEVPVGRYRSASYPAAGPWPDMEVEGDVALAGMEEISEEGDEPGMAAKAGGKLHEAKERATGAAERTGERLAAGKDRMADWGRERSHLAGRGARRALRRSRSAGRRMGDGLRHGYQSGVDHLEDAVEDYPLAVGIGFAALGALAGVLLPRTEREDEWLGERSDEWVDHAKEKGEDLLERGKEIGGRAAEAAMEEAREQGLTPQAAKEKLSDVAGKVGQVAHRAKEEATAAATQEEKPNPPAGSPPQASPPEFRELTPEPGTEPPPGSRPGF